VLRWASEDLLHLKPEEIGEHYGRYRLHLPEPERAMARSLKRYGQLSPVVVCRRQERYELIDGFKRLGAARHLVEMEHLAARLMEADERSAKAAIYGLNRAGGRTRELEEAWIIHALVREDGMSQVEVAELLGRHKSWVCRRRSAMSSYGSAVAKASPTQTVTSERATKLSVIAGGKTCPEGAHESGSATPAAIHKTNPPGLDRWRARSIVIQGGAD
jgi:hypothetical protein